ncbi:hypothetical protein AX774_g1844 [Zancudomyces culisetae]|uniref:Uncharacterized protein n=1 Tax=Zancudomyces culisetae TaxID=1213189 RepID=A0A1R1PUR2_ZANCU|nr:hypothetical protein AX774_g1844 [Zancudomyces culisetae]|eukprot:OMH84632.1 hypothetical protein AX774_g1844 [Zancudomyces culisetae]
MWLFPALRNPTIISPRFSPKFFSSSLTSSLLTTSNCIVSTSSGNGPKYPGNPSLNHRVSRISSIPIRFTGSTSNIRLINSLASPLTWLGILNIPLLIFLNNAGMLSSSNGSFPHNITYNITPHDHTSTSGPAYNLPLITSGAA